MKKLFKVFGIFLGVILLAALVLAILNIKSVLLFLGMGRLEVKDFDSAVSKIKDSGLFKDMKRISSDETDANEKTEGVTFTSHDEAVQYTIKGEEGEEITQIEAQVDGNKIDNMDYTNIEALKKKAEEYLSPIISDDQVLGLSGYIAKEALEQYNQGKTQIKIEKNFDGVYVRVEGDITTGIFDFFIDTNP